MTGTVIKSTGSWYEVRTVEGQNMRCRLKGKFKLEDKKVTNPIAVGDRVEIVEEDKGEDSWVITDILPRENYVLRKAVKKTEHAHIIGANIDQVVLMATLKLPRTSLGFIDRVLVTAETYRIPTFILWNKSDLLNKKGREQIEELMAIYEQVGYRSKLITALEQEEVESLRKELNGKINLVLGHSGVGKSTLLNHLIPGLEQKISEVSSFANKGVHTTTFAEMFVLDNETFIIDTPGIKELGLSEVYEEELSHYFPEMRAMFGECKFHNCSHVHEPKCAVIEAVENGIIAPSRYYSYLSMLEDDDNRR